MVTVTIDISNEDERTALDLARQVANTHGFGRLGAAKDLLDWLLHKRSLGLKIEEKGARTWHVSVPR